MENDIKKFIRDGKLDIALEVLINNGVKDAIIFLTNYRKTQNDFGLGIITYQDVITINSKTTLGILNLLSQLNLKEENLVLEKKKSNNNFSVYQKSELMLKKLWDDLYLHRYYYEYYELQFEKQKTPKSTLYGNKEQISLLSNMRTTCYDYSNALETLLIKYLHISKPYVEEFNVEESYNELKKMYEKRIFFLDENLILPNNKTLTKKAESNAYNYFNNIYKLK